MITLSAGGYTAKIDPSRGGNCISLRHAPTGARILREPLSYPLDNPYLYGMPILFPVNRIAGGRFTFEGREYRFPINEQSTGCHLHGTLHETPFAVAEQTPTSVRLVFDAPYLDFPHRFCLSLAYTLSERGLSVVCEVRNRSDENMPVFLGYHTTFTVPFLEGSDARDCRVFADLGDEIERNMANYLPTGRILPPDDVTRRLQTGDFPPHEKPISRHYRAAGEGRIRLTDTLRGVRVVYENSENLSYRLFYNGQADAYICLEPQTCMANCQNAPFAREETGFDVIPPRGKKTYLSRIYLETL